MTEKRQELLKVLINESPSKDWEVKEAITEILSLRVIDEKPTDKVDDLIESKINENIKDITSRWYRIVASRYDWSNENLSEEKIELIKQEIKYLEKRNQELLTKKKLLKLDWEKNNK